MREREREREKLRKSRKPRKIHVPIVLMKWKIWFIYIICIKIHGRFLGNSTQKKMAISWKCQHIPLVLGIIFQRV